MNFYLFNNIAISRKNDLVGRETEVKEQDISWDIRKEKFKQEKLKELQKEIDTEKYGIDLEDDRELER